MVTAVSNSAPDTSCLDSLLSQFLSVVSAHILLLHSVKTQSEESRGVRGADGKILLVVVKHRNDLVFAAGLNTDSPQNNNHSVKEHLITSQSAGDKM